MPNENARQWRAPARVGLARSDPANGEAGQLSGSCRGPWQRSSPMPVSRVRSAISIPPLRCRLSASDACSVERSVALELKETASVERDRAGDLAPPVSGLDHRNMRRGIRKSIGGARAYRRGMSSTRSPERVRLREQDRFLESVGVLRDWLKYIGRDATWQVALASAVACVSTQIPLPNDTAFARALLFVSAVTIGALTGRRLDRRKRRKP